VRAAVAALVPLLACSRPSHEARPRAVPAQRDAARTTRAAPAAPVAKAAPPPTADEDLGWLLGTWERQGAPRDWLLFNPPNEVVVISGKPAAVTLRGEFIANGRFVSLIFRQPGGSVVEHELQAPPDRSELREGGPTPAAYRRGAPP
jgi:hypothetical protein